MSESAILAAKGPYLNLRCRVIQVIRTFFLGQGFLEVQTPLLTPAPVPEPHINAMVAGDRFLATSPELYMKRLLAAGYEKIFQITPVFRLGEQGRFHHPEFTILEWYRLHGDYLVLQEDCKELLVTVCEATNRGTGWQYQGRRLEVNGQWQSYTVRDAFVELAGWDPVAIHDPNRFDLDLVEKVEPHLGYPTPCILKDYPRHQAALARLKLDDPRVAERFELYWAGLELANGFSELTDSSEQRRRFEECAEMRRQAGYPTYPLPEKFLRSLKTLAPCAGIAFGVDRLVLLLTDADHLDMVVPFHPGME